MRFVEDDERREIRLKLYEALLPSYTDTLMVWDTPMV